MLPAMDPKMLPQVVTSSPTPVNTAPKPNSRKYMIVAVAVLLVVVCTIAGVLLAVHIVQKAHEETMKEYFVHFHNAEGKEIGEKIQVDASKNIVIYGSPSDPLQTAHDVAHGLIAYKTLGSQPLCLIRPTTTPEVDAQEVQRILAKNHGMDDFPKRSIATNLTLSPQPIRETSFLSAELQSFCKDVAVHWVMHADEKEAVPEKPNAGNRREKRQSGLIANPQFSPFVYFGNRIYICCTTLTQSVFGRESSVSRPVAIIGNCRFCEDPFPLLG
ncbi:uncharacterized protein LOC106159100 [Lingula anatina]|uniref:Uncharacterized protein LOC106159100 n=1 Tax=Lingula anatina TaxID=7574 RepID=A0A1S3HXI3_LINAN|nr:uncharacterized protein LOC106159100 [Lingula anatina]|eukprot:XP_013390740.1 uncharacterized protein LOC106159100 [Lingula anatina]